MQIYFTLTILSTLSQILPCTCDSLALVYGGMGGGAVNKGLLANIITTHNII